MRSEGMYVASDLSVGGLKSDSISDSMDSRSRRSSRIVDLSSGAAGRMYAAASGCSVRTTAWADVDYRGGRPAVPKAAGPQLMVLPGLTPRVNRSSTRQLFPRSAGQPRGSIACSSPHKPAVEAQMQ
jgi:hypothetical protein